MKHLLMKLSFVLMMGLVFTSCSKDDSENSGKKSISGTWESTVKEFPISAQLDANVTEDGMPCRITAMETMDFTGFYNYTPATGKGTFIVSMPIPNGKMVYEGTLQYNDDGTLTCKIPELIDQKLMPAEGVALVRRINK